MLIKNKKNDLNIFVWPLSLEKDPWRKVDAALRFGKVKWDSLYNTYYIILEQMKSLLPVIASAEATISASPAWIMWVSSTDSMGSIPKSINQSIIN